MRFPDGLPDLLMEGHIFHFTGPGGAKAVQVPSHAHPADSEVVDLIVSNRLRDLGESLWQTLTRPL
jgi:hypothetical protein